MTGNTEGFVESDRNVWIADNTVIRSLARSNYRWLRPFDSLHHGFLDLVLRTRASHFDSTQMRLGKQNMSEAWGLACRGSIEQASERNDMR